MSFKLNTLIEAAHGNSINKGWYGPTGDDQRNVPEMLALIHSEVSEALEDFRDGKMIEQTQGGEPLVAYGEYPDPGIKPCGFPSEMADIVIRVADLCGYLKIDLEGAVRRKLAYNKTRPSRHGGKKC